MKYTIPKTGSMHSLTCSDSRDICDIQNRCCSFCEDGSNVQFFQTPREPSTTFIDIQGRLWGHFPEGTNSTYFVISELTPYYGENATISPKFKKGDIVKIKKTNNTFIWKIPEEEYTTLHVVDEDGDYIFTLDNNKCRANFEIEDLELVSKDPFSDYTLKKVGKNVSEVVKMELKELNKDNLKEAKKQYNDEKANAEIEFAKQQLRKLNDRKDSLVREIKTRLEEVDKIDEELKVFK